MTTTESRPHNIVALIAAIIFTIVYLPSVIAAVQAVRVNILMRETKDQWGLDADRVMEWLNYTLAFKIASLAITIAVITFGWVLYARRRIAIMYAVFATPLVISTLAIALGAISR